MIDVRANAAVHAAFTKGKANLGAWEVIDAGVGAFSDAGDVAEGVIGGTYDFLVPLVAIGAIAFALTQGK